MNALFWVARMSRASFVKTVQRWVSMEEYMEELETISTCKATSISAQTEQKLVSIHTSQV